MQPKLAAEFIEIGRQLSAVQADRDGEVHRRCKGQERESHKRAKRSSDAFLQLLTSASNSALFLRRRSGHAFFRGVVVAVGSDFAKAPLSAAFEPCPKRHAHHARRAGRIPSPFGPALRVAQRVLSLLFTSKVLCDPQPRFDATHRLRQLSEYNSRYRLPVARQEIGHCGHWFNDMTAAGRDPMPSFRDPSNSSIMNGRCREIECSLTTLCSRSPYCGLCVASRSTTAISGMTSLASFWLGPTFSNRRWQGCYKSHS
jgi:hypothetical protein